MCAYVCGQCHVEYYFQGTEKRLVYPWTHGLKVGDMLGYHDGIGFIGWTHAESGAPMPKAQHPGFELWNQGIHARSGVACASGASEAELARAQELQRRAQFFLDFMEVENSMGYHAPQESARILGKSINFSRRRPVTMRDRTWR